MVVVVACACALPSSPLRLMLIEVLRAWGEPVFIARWWLLVVNFLVRCLLERILALMAYILVVLLVSFEIF